MLTENIVCNFLSAGGVIGLSYLKFFLDLPSENPHFHITMSKPQKYLPNELVLAIYGIPSHENSTPK